MPLGLRLAGTLANGWTRPHGACRDKTGARLYYYTVYYKFSAPDSFLAAFRLYGSLAAAAMETELRQPTGREGNISALNAATKSLKLRENTSTITPAKTVFGSVNTLLTTIRVGFLPFCNDLLLVYIQLGLDGR